MRQYWQRQGGWRVSNVISRNVRIRIYAASQSTLESEGGAAPEFTLTIADLAEAPELPGVTPRPLQGSVETNAMQFDVLGGQILANLADADGRVHLKGRLAEVQQNDDEAGWETVAVGRINRLSESEGPGLFRVEVQDEQWKARNTKIFTDADTTAVYPLGTIYQWRNTPALSRRALQRRVPLLDEVFDDAGTTRLGSTITYFFSNTITTVEHLQWVADFYEPDADPTNRFGPLRIEINGTLHPIQDIHPLFDILENPSDEDGDGTIVVELDVAVFAHDTDGMIGEPSLPGADSDDRFRLVTEGAEPSEMLPLHVGVADASHAYGTADGGIDIFDLFERLADEHGVRYDSAATGALKGTLPSIAPRITQSWTFSDFFAKYAFAPGLIVPHVNELGQIAPYSVRMPAADELPDPDNDGDVLEHMFTFDATNVDTEGGPPTWRSGSEEAVNQLVFSVVPIRQKLTSVQFGFGALPVLNSESRLDGFAAGDAQESRFDPYDTVDRLGERPKTFYLDAWPESVVVEWRGHVGGTVPTKTHPRSYVRETLAAHIYNRFGDGPQEGNMVGLESTDSVTPGDLVVLDQDVLKGPNAASNDRTGSRIVQILEKDRLAGTGFRFRYLDAGPGSQQLAAPTVAVSANPTFPHHAVTVQLSDGVLDGKFVVEFATDSGFSDADIVYRTVRSQAGFFNPRVMPSGSTIHVRARNIKPNRLASEWSATDSATTTALTAPSALTATPSGTSADLAWTNGESDYRIAVELDGELIDVLPAGSTGYTLEELAESTAFNSPGAQVYHVDDFGGTSSPATDTFTTGAAVTLGAVPAVAVLRGVDPLTF